ncbi:hypothetical protein [Amycolatopsis taiwanensis]|uniref:hypothetical protein n=1 Tax=Amycolatopsis taiwanensis TaxID=342230 RepID=UPI00255543E8|nr:hypothetical protein [Amycolatopsis taiwanensis]
MNDIHNEIQGFVYGSVVQAGSITGDLHIHQAAQSSTVMNRTITADALMRGPIQAIEGLAERVATAERAASTDPVAAASAYEDIASTLEVNGYHGHALLMLQQAAATLEAGYCHDDAAQLLVRLIEDMIGAGEASEAAAAVHHLHRLANSGNLSAGVATRTTYALSLYGTVQHPFDELNELARTLDLLAAAEDSSFPLYALVLGEAAVATNQKGYIRERIGIFSTAARKTKSEDVRICTLLAAAEATDEWGDLVSDAKKHRLPPAWNAAVLARYARYLTLTAAADEADEYWREAINRGALAGLGVDTSEWLYAIRENTLRYGPITDNLETHHLAQAMQASGGTRLLPTIRNNYEDALSELRARKLPAACQAARRALRESVTSGHLMSEQLAAELLAEIYASSGEPQRAAVLYIRTGNSESLCAMAGGLGDIYLDVEQYIGQSAPWQRAAAYAAVATQSDLVPDDHVSELVAAALTEVEASLAGRTREGPFAPQVGLAALDVLAALIERANFEQAEQSIELLASLVYREPGRYRHTDEAHIRLLTGVLGCCKPLRSAAAKQLIDMLALDEHISDQVVDIASPVIMLHPDLFVEPLVDLAVDHQAAARLLIRLNHPLPEENALAVEAFERLVSPYEPKPGVTALGLGFTRDSMVILNLTQSNRDAAARALLGRARDRKEAAANRADALVALRILSDVISADVRTELFEAGLNFGRGEEDGSALDTEFGAMSRHILSARSVFQWEAPPLLYLVSSWPRLRRLLIKLNRSKL